jgi:hypothetical protein
MKSLRGVMAVSILLTILQRHRREGRAKNLREPSMPQQYLTATKVK